MTYVVLDNCIKCKYMDCVDVCPVECFYEGANMLVIHPDDCIDCGVCEAECPAEAIIADTVIDAQPELAKWRDINAEYSRSGKWPNIPKKTRDAPADADAWNRIKNDQVKDKSDLFDPAPGAGD